MNKRVICDQLCVWTRPVFDRFFDRVVDDEIRSMIVHSNHQPDENELKVLHAVVMSSITAQMAPAGNA